MNCLRTGFAAALTLASAWFAFAGVGFAVGEVMGDLQPVSLTFAREKIAFPSPAAYGNDTVTYASLSALAPRLGASLGWIQETQTARVAGAAVVVYVTIERPVALVNGREKAMAAAPLLIRGQTYVPLTDFVGFFGYETRKDSGRFSADVYLPAAKVTGLRLEGDVGRQVLVVETDRHVEYRSFTLVNPDRFVLDLKGAKAEPGEHRVAGAGVIRQVRLSQFDGATVRVVVDLERLVGFKVTQATAPDRIAVGFNLAVTAVQAAGFPAGDGGATGDPGPDRSMTPGPPFGPERVRVSATGPMKYTLRYLDSPRRIAVDVGDATLAAPAEERVLGGGLAQVMRVSQLDSGTVRLVLEVPDGVVARDLTPPQPAQAASGQLEFGLLAEVSRVEVRPPDEPPDNKQRGQAYMVEIGSAGTTLPAEVEIIPAGAAAGKSGSAVEFTINEAALSVPYDVVGPAIGPIRGIRAIQTDPVTIKVRIDLEPGATAELAPSPGNDAQRTSTIRVLVRRAPEPTHGGAEAGSAGSPGAGAGVAAIGTRVVVLDPGHGGVDVGSIGPQGTLEKDITTDVTRRVQVALESRGVKTLLTRPNGDVSVGLTQRAAMANDVQAAALVSIHANWFAENYARGTETYYQQGDERSHRLAEAIHGRLVAALGTVDRGLKPAPGFVVLKQAMVPAVLVEVAFLSNDNEEKLLGQPEFRQTAAAAIAEGIVDFLGNGVQAPDGNR